MSALGRRSRVGVAERRGRIDRRVHAFYWLLRRLPGADVTKMTADDLIRATARVVRRNRLLDAICGPVAPGVRSRDLTIPGPHEPLAVRVYTPPGPERVRPLVLHLHGGGFALGNLEMGDWIAGHLALGADVVVVSVAYRLAPAHPFPAAVEDCWAGLRWAVEHAAEIGADGADLSVMGESAGGNLAAVMCLMARDAGGPPIRRQTLMYPALDLAGGSESLQRIGDQPFLRLAAMEIFASHYLGAERSDATDWRASPLHAADHSNLPPAFILVPEFDPLHDDGVRYGAALRASGVEARVRVYGSMPHAFLNFPGVCRSARAAMGHIVEWHRDI